MGFCNARDPWAIGALWHLVGTKLSIPLQKKIDELPTILESSPEVLLLHLRYRFLSLLLGIIYLPLFILHVSLDLTRLAVALALTIAAFFPVLAIHGISQIIRAYKIHKIEALEVIDPAFIRQSLQHWLEHNPTITIENVLEATTLNATSIIQETIRFADLDRKDEFSPLRFYLPLFKLNQPEKKQEGLEDLADLSTNFNKEFSRK